MAAHSTLLSLILIGLVAVFIFSVEHTVSSFVEGDGDGDDQQFDFSVEDVPENHFTYSDMSNG